MLSCELVTFISTFSCCLAKGKSVEEISLMSAVFMLIGDNLATIAAQEVLCVSLEEARRKEESREIEHSTRKDECSNNEEQLNLEC